MDRMNELDGVTLRGLQRLIGENLNSAEAYRVAAEQASDSMVAGMLSLLARDRRQHARELQGYVRLNDQVPRGGMTGAGVLRSIWADLRITFTGSDLHVIFAMAERAEARLFGIYQRMLAEAGGSPANALLLRHARRVKAACNRMCALADAHAPLEV